MAYLLRLATNGYAQLASTFSVASASSLSVKFKASFTGVSEIYGLGTSTAERLQYNGSGFFFRLAGVNGNTITTATIASLVSGYNVANPHEYELRKIPFEDGTRTKYRLFVEGIDCGELMSIFNSGGATFQFSRIGSASTGFFNGDLYYMDCYVDGVKTRSYDPSATGGSGSTLVDTTDGQNGTMNGTYSWVFYSTGGGAYTLNADGGTYSYSGGAVSLRLNRSLQAAGGSFSYAGGVATLTYTPAGVSYTLNADGGLFSYSGGNAALRINRKIQASGGAYSYSGGNAGLSRGYKVNAAGGVYGYSGGASTLDYVPATGYTLAALGASFSYAGGDATFNYSQTYPQAVASDFTVIGRLSDSANYSAIMYQSTTYSGRLN